MGGFNYVPADIKDFIAELQKAATTAELDPLDFVNRLRTEPQKVENELIRLFGSLEKFEADASMIESLPYLVDFLDNYEAAEIDRHLTTGGR